VGPWEDFTDLANTASIAALYYGDAVAGDNGEVLLVVDDERVLELLASLLAHLVALLYELDGELGLLDLLDVEGTVFVLAGANGTVGTQRAHFPILCGVAQGLAADAVDIVGLPLGAPDENLLGLVAVGGNLLALLAGALSPADGALDVADLLELLGLAGGIAAGAHGQGAHGGGERGAVDGEGGREAAAGATSGQRAIGGLRMADGGRRRWSRWLNFADSRAALGGRILWHHVMPCQFTRSRIHHSPSTPSPIHSPRMPPSGPLLLPADDAAAPAQSALPLLRQLRARPCLAHAPDIPLPTL
jgi:hypothetical protein